MGFCPSRSALRPCAWIAKPGGCYKSVTASKGAPGQSSAETSCKLHGFRPSEMGIIYRGYLCTAFSQANLQGRSRLFIHHPYSACHGISPSTKATTTHKWIASTVPVVHPDRSNNQPNVHENAAPEKSSVLFYITDSSMLSLSLRISIWVSESRLHPSDLWPPSPMPWGKKRTGQAIT